MSALIDINSTLGDPCDYASVACGILMRHPVRRHSIRRSQIVSLEFHTWEENPGFIGSLLLLHACLKEVLL